ncbi:MAG: hypothetical protein DRJ40_01770 [Thermoprotei archaeon]|nr:MAG: hypothetical protein DRJ40_01770 [Thermoprotei archaeon]
MALPKSVKLREETKVCKLSTHPLFRERHSLEELSTLYIQVHHCTQPHSRKLRHLRYHLSYVSRNL